MLDPGCAISPLRGLWYLVGNCSLCVSAAQVSIKDSCGFKSQKRHFCRFLKLKTAQNLGLQQLLPGWRNQFYSSAQTGVLLSPFLLLGGGELFRW